jgi:hypothetical protein
VTGPSGNPGPSGSRASCFFVLNTLEHRQQYKNNIDRANLYYTPCGVLDCGPDKDRNYQWKSLPPKKLDCSEVVDCAVEEYTLSVQERNYLRLELRTAGINVGFPPAASTSISDPGGWGERGKWPVFFFCVFLAMKFVKALDGLFQRKGAAE